MWDDHERALVDALFDWRADQHTCGRQLKESLRVDGLPGPDYIVGELVCLGCKAEAEWKSAKAKTWEREHEQGIHPEGWTIPFVTTRGEALEQLKKQQT